MCGYPWTLVENVVHVYLFLPSHHNEPPTWKLDHGLWLNFIKGIVIAEFNYSFFFQKLDPIYTSCI